MLKYIAAMVVSVIVGSALAAPAAAQAPYDNEQVAKIKQESDRLRATETQSTAPSPEQAVEAETVTDTRSQTCADCPPPRPHYDKVEVVKTSRDVDQSRVINTQSVVNVPARTRETNKLVVRENETRNVGVVQHNHTIIEKEIRYVKRRAPVYRAYRVETTYQPVCQNGALVYWIVRRGGEATVMSADVNVGYGNPCSSPCNCSGTIEAYRPQPVHRRSYSYYDAGVPARTVRIPVQAYGAYR